MIEKSRACCPLGSLQSRVYRSEPSWPLAASARRSPRFDHIGGVRPDALQWHPHGLALDVIIPNPGTAEGIALGNEIVAFVLKNATRFGLQDVIWRGIYYTPKGPQGTGAGHYDHVHITTTGGGYPTGSEIYVR